MSLRRALFARLAVISVVTLTHPAPRLDALDMEGNSGPEAMERLAILHGTWVAEGRGFTSTLSYSWSLPGALLRARNEVRNDSGALLARYEGHYAWDEGTRTIVFWTVSEGGELHRGEAAWKGDRLWHAATVTGGGIEGYRSVLEVADGRLLYHAVYEPSARDEAVLESEPLVYARRSPSGR